MRATTPTEWLQSFISYGFFGRESPSPAPAPAPAPTSTATAAANDGESPPAHHQRATGSGSGSSSKKRASRGASASASTSPSSSSSSSTAPAHEQQAPPAPATTGGGSGSPGEKPVGGAGSSRGLSARQQELTQKVLSLLGPEGSKRFGEALLGLILVRGRANLDVRVSIPDEDGEGEGGGGDGCAGQRIYADLELGYEPRAYACMDQVRYGAVCRRVLWGVGWWHGSTDCRRTDRLTTI